MQNTCKPALIYLQLPSATPSPTLSVVSEWYQLAQGYRVFLAQLDQDQPGSWIRTSGNAYFF